MFKSTWKKIALIFIFKSDLSLTVQIPYFLYYAITPKIHINHGNATKIYRNDKTIRREASLEIFSLLKLEPLEMKFESCFLKISKIYIFSHFCGVSVLISFLIFSLLYYFCLFCHITARCVFLLKLSPSRTIPFCFGFVLQNFVYVCLLWALMWEMKKKILLT